MPQRRRVSLLLACVLIGELIAALLLPHHPAEAGSSAQRTEAVAPSDSTQTIPLADGRSVRLVGLDGGSDTHALRSRIAAGIGAAVDTVAGFWGSDWSREISIVVAGTDEQFRAAAGGGSAAQWGDIAAVTMVERVDPVARTMVDGRIVFAPGATKMSDGALRIVLTHELFHYAARVDTALDAPRWLTEGVADFVARPLAALPADAASGMQSLPADSELDTPGPARSLAYDRAWWFARFVASAYGAAKLRELYVAACGVGHADVTTAVREVLGIDTTSLLTRWQQWSKSGT